MPLYTAVLVSLTQVEGTLVCTFSVQMCVYLSLLTTIGSQMSEDVLSRQHLRSVNNLC